MYTCLMFVGRMYTNRSKYALVDVSIFLGGRGLHCLVSSRAVARKAAYRAAGAAQSRDDDLGAHGRAGGSVEAEGRGFAQGAFGGSVQGYGKYRLRLTRSRILNMLKVR